eukprot:scaffold1779_cov71-Phaeocystis_antarctica.AAC.3
MEEDWRPKVEAHRPQIVLKIKQKLEKLVAPGGDDAARETKLNQIATQFETMQWRDASTRHDYTERITKNIKTLCTPELTRNAMRDTGENFQAQRRQLGLAVARGDAGAQATLGDMHRGGDGGPVDFAEARRLLGLAAAQGLANAQCMLGRMHHDGDGGPVDFAEVRWLYGLAVAQGHAGAQHQL